MPRSPRRASESGLYHVVARGNGRQNIFEDDADRRLYLDLLRKEVAARNGDLLAWCLMDNHVHLLLSMGLDEMSNAVRVANGCYALSFNRRHGRVGSLFDGRFWSEPIEDDGYFLDVIRYIHRNPVKAGMTDDCSYQWSSYEKILDDFSSDDPGVVAAVFETRDEYERFHRFVGEPFADIERQWGRLTEDEARKLANGVAGVSLHEIKELPRRIRDDRIARMRAVGLSVRQIERLTGVGRGIISRVKYRK